MNRASEKGGAEPFVHGLSDYWLAELMRRLLLYKLIKSELLDRIWIKVRPRFDRDGREVVLSEDERHYARTTIVRNIEVWMKESSK